MPCQFDHGDPQTVPWTSWLGFCPDNEMKILSPHKPWCVPFQTVSNQFKLQQLDFS